MISCLTGAKSRISQPCSFKGNAKTGIRTQIARVKGSASRAFYHHANSTFVNSRGFGLCVFNQDVTESPSTNKKVGNLVPFC